MPRSPRQLCFLVSVFSFGHSASDMYRELGLRRGASSADIKAAYRDAAKRYHPDKNKDPNAQERFRRIASAYEALSDPDKRRLYDLHGEDYTRVEQERQRHDQHRRQQEEFFNVFGGHERRRNKGPPIFSSTLWVSSEAYRALIELSADAWLLQFYHGAHEPSGERGQAAPTNVLPSLPLASRLLRFAQIGANHVRNLRRTGRRSRPSCRRWSSSGAST